MAVQVQEFINCCGVANIYVGSHYEQHAREHAAEQIRHSLRLHNLRGMFLIVLTNSQVKAGVGKVVEEFGFKRMADCYNGNSGYRLNLYVLTREAKDMR